MTIHAALVHFPITTTVLTAGLDAVYFASTYGPTASTVAAIFKTLGIAIPPSSFPTLSYYTTILTLFFLVPSIISGGAELMPVTQRDGFSSKKARIGITHGAIMDAAFAATAYNWWTRRSTQGFTPDATNILISAMLAMPLTLYSASLGGALVYNYGMGFKSTSAKKKQ